MRSLLITITLFTSYLPFSVQGQILDTIYPSLGGEQGVILYDFDDKNGRLKFKAMDHRSLTSDQYFASIDLTNNSLVNGVGASHLWDLSLINDTLYCETDNAKGFWAYHYHPNSSPAFLKFVDWQFPVYDVFGFDNKILAYYRGPSGIRELAILNDTLGPDSVIAQIRSRYIQQFRGISICSKQTDKLFYSLCGNGEVLIYRLDHLSSTWDSTLNTITSVYDTALYDWSGGPHLKWFNDHLYLQFAVREKMSGSYLNHDIIIVEFDSIGKYTEKSWSFPVHAYQGFANDLNYYSDYIVNSNGELIVTIFNNRWDMETWRNPKSKIMKISASGNTIWNHTP